MDNILDGTIDLSTVDWNSMANAVARARDEDRMMAALGLVGTSFHPSRCNADIVDG